MKQIFKYAAMGFLSCVFIDAGLGVVAELMAENNVTPPPNPVDPVESITPTEPLEVKPERIPLSELPNGCHYHLGSDTPHCGVDEKLEISW